MTNSPLWLSIANNLTEDLAQGLYSPGEKLPSEAELAARFGVNRHTLRQAVAHLTAQGLVQARRGAGIFVTARPTDYAIGRRTRFSQSMQASGRLPSRQVLRIETRRAGPREAEALEISPHEDVHVFEGISLADGTPMGLFCSYFPASKLPDLPEALRASHSVTAALKACGLPDYLRSHTRLTAEIADPLIAAHLRIPVGSAVLRSEALNRASEGWAVEFGRTWFAGERVALTVAGE